MMDFMSNLCLMSLQSWEVQSTESVVNGTPSDDFRAFHRSLFLLQAQNEALLLFTFSNSALCLGRIINSHIVVRSKTKRSWVPINQLPPMMTSYKVRLQCYNQDINICT